MTTQVTKQQANFVSALLTSLHSGRDYFKRVEITRQDIGYGVDLWVDGEKWRAREDQGPQSSVIEHVPICVILVG